MNRYPDQPMIDINDDAPCIAVRKALRAAITKEQSQIKQETAAE